MKTAEQINQVLKKWKSYQNKEVLDLVSKTRGLSFRRIQNRKEDPLNQILFL
jgi:hypothetical protein